MSAREDVCFVEGRCDDEEPLHSLYSQNEESLLALFFNKGLNLMHSLYQLQISFDELTSMRLFHIAIGVYIFSQGAKQT